MITYNKSIDTTGVSWSVPTGTRSGTLRESPFKTHLPCGAGVDSKANSRRCWPSIKDTCVPSHLIEAGFPERETTLEQYDKTNRFKDITTVFVIGTLFMVHGNWFLWGIFLFKKDSFSKSSTARVFLAFFFLLDIILSWRAHHDDRFQTFPNLITGLQKPQTMPWQACHLRSQAKVLPCFFFFFYFFSFFSSLWCEVKNKDISYVF